MNLTPLLIQSEKHYRLACDKTPDECAALLEQICSGRTERGKPLVGTLDAKGFKVHKRTGPGGQLFQPSVQGTFAERQGVTGTDIKLQLTLNTLGTSTINAPANIIFGSVFGVILCAFFLQDAVAVSYAFLYMVMVPAVLMLVAAIAATVIVSEDCKAIVDLLAIKLEATKTAECRRKTPIKAVLLGETPALIVGIIAFVGFAYFLHNLAWNLWCKGQYTDVEAFCRPVYEFTNSLLGESSGASSDCRYFLAECLRCRSKLRESSHLYQKSIDLFAANPGAKAVFVADNKFGLARIEDQSGRHQDAEHLYKEAIEGWSQSQQIGPKSIWVSRALDRLAMLYLKEGKFADAKEAIDRALVIDRALGKHAGRSVGEDLNDKALIFDKEERYDTAGKLYEEALQEKERVVGKNHYSVGTTLYNLSYIRKLQHRQQESDQLASRASKIWTAALGPDRYPDQFREYMKIINLTRSEYEVPFADTRVDGLRPYLGRT